MPRSRRRLGLAFAGLLLPVLLAAAPPSQNTTPDAGEWRPSLLPRAFQKNPLVDQTVITEMTDEGRKLPPPSPDHPAYYVAEIAGNRSEGQGPEDSKLPTVEELRSSLQRALAVNGYLPTSKGHPPTLLIVYFWGAHTNLDEGSSEVEGSGTPDIGHKNLLSRAALVGGAKFAEELRVALNKQQLDDEARMGLAPEIAGMLSNFGPLRLFTERDAKTRQLYSEALGDCYYAIASAYDYAAALKGGRRLLWRTKMTVDAQSVTMRDTLPGLIASAGQYLGTDMTEAATITKRLHHETSVKLGPLEVQEYLDRPPAPPPAKAKP